ncbi:hypothetical protein CHISP_1560 [Chitinispirillum alkaliphilum]|nr:hypothetical protein CHISP_1560 [Chitinispirillum alkaliphilum]
MRIFSRTENVVFRLVSLPNIKSENDNNEIETVIVPIDKIEKKVWDKVAAIQGRKSVLYLRYRYGRTNAFVLTAFHGEKLAHVQWIVPQKQISKRYPFVDPKCYSIISCVTAPEYRGKGIYPAQLKKVIGSGISQNGYYIWAESMNKASLHGIVKAGGTSIGRFLHKKFMGGLISKVYFTPDGKIDQNG